MINWLKRLFCGDKRYIITVISFENTRIDYVCVSDPDGPDFLTFIHKKYFNMVGGFRPKNGKVIRFVVNKREIKRRLENITRDLVKCENGRFDFVFGELWQPRKKL